MPKQKGAEAQGQELKERFVKRVGELWDIHYDKASKVLKDSEDKKITITFKAKIDFSESSPKLKSGIRYAEVNTDEVDDTFEPIPDPNEPNLLSKEELEKTRRKKNVREELAERGD